VKKDDEMKTIISSRLLIKSIRTLGPALLLGLPLLAQHEQTPINIDRTKTVKDTAPPAITFNNYSFADLKVENTYGATEKFYTAVGTPTAPGDLKTVTLNSEWGTLKATPCSDSSLTSCASYATRLSNGPSVSVDNQQYVLQQFHFHAPAEHTVDGQRAALEIHFVHLLNNGCAADDHRPGVVLGAFIVEGPPDRELGMFFDTLGPELPHNSADKARYVRANLSALLPAGKYKWRYDGGLTAPAGSGLCGVVIPESIPGGGTVAQQLIAGVFPEVVHWFLYEKPLQLSREQIARFKELFPEGNARAIKENTNPVYETASVPVVTPPPSGSPTAVANPKNVTVTSRSIQLDGSQSTSADGKPLTYLWTVAQGSPSAAISNGSTATPTVQFTQGHVTYTFQLTVTDSAGKSASDLATVNYQGN
jgi:carbonic anhydrase